MLKKVNLKHYTSNLLVKETNDFLRKGLSLMPARRFNDVEEMRAAIMRLMELKNEYELVSNPKYANKYFVCRESELEQIDAILNEKNYVILEGMGGIGKTELVKKYAEKYKAEYDIVQFVTFNGNLESTIAVSLLFNNFDASRYTKIHGDNTMSEMYRDKIIRLKDKKYGKRTLIVMDNYNTSHDDKFSEFTSGEYKVIFTSREKHEGKVFLEINNMENKADLLALFRSYYAPPELAPEDEATINEIIDLVLGHTMTVMLIALAMRENRKTPKEMLERLQNSLDPRLRTKITVEKEGLNSEDRSKVMYEHVQPLFDMTEIQANENYAFVMTNMALVPYAGLDIRTFYDWALREHYESQGHNDEYYGDLEDLIKRRWVQSSNGWVSLHPVISDVADKVLMPDSKKCVALIQSLIKFAEDSKDETQAERVNSMNVLELACKRITDETEVTANLLNGFAGVANSLADYDIAMVYFLKVSGIREKALGKEHLDTATTYNNIATVYSAQEDYPKALEWYRKALVIREKVLGTEHPDTATTYNKIAFVYTHQGDYPKALEWYHKALGVYEKVLGKEHPSTATTYNNIAGVYANQSDYPKALEWYHKALGIREKVLGKEHLNTAITYGSIADVYSKQGDYPNALEWYRKAFVICEKVLGTEYHPNITTTYVGIATIYSDQGDYPKALEWHFKALAVHEKVLSKEHPHTAISYNSIANVYREQSDYPKALEWYHKALAVCEKVLGEEHPSTATIYNNIASVYSNQGDYPKALEWHLKALAIREKVLGKEHPDTATTYNNIANVYFYQGDYPKALEWHLKALTVCEKVLGKEHPDTATT